MSSLSALVDSVLRRDIDRIDEILSVKDGAREEAIRITREIIRSSAEAVRLIHVGRYDEAHAKIMAARDSVEKLKEILRDHPEIFYSGLVYNSLCEYVEAVLVYNMIVKKRFLEFSELKVPYIPFLQGLADVVGELRRHVIDLLKEERFSEAREYLEVMDIIYQVLKRLHYPDALVPSLRHKVDVARRLVEDTKVLFITTYTASNLKRSINELLEALRKPQ